jgi:diguanylate cyclase (GGDEF)-like protein
MLYMRLLSLAAGLISIIVIAGFGSMITVRQHTILPALHALERAADLKDVQQLHNAFDVQRMNLLTAARDYALSDETYNFLRKTSVTDKQNAARFPLDTFLNLNVNVVMLVSYPGDRPVIFREADLQKEIILDAPRLSFAEWQPWLIEMSDVVAGAPLMQSGYLQTSRGPMVYAVMSVLRSDSSGASPGALLMARYVDEAFLQEVADIGAYQFKATSLSVDSANLVVSNDQVMRDNDNRIKSVLTALDGSPLLLLDMQLMPRQFNAGWIDISVIAALLCIVMVSLLALMILHRRIIRPIRQLQTHLQMVRESGDYSLRLSSRLGNEIGQLIGECNALVFHAQNEQLRHQDDARGYREMSVQDALTGIHNRRGFDLALQRELAAAKRHNAPLSLILCDIDYFKLFNDTYGHQGGDTALKAVAMILDRARSRETDVVARFGGEELAMILPDTDMAGAKKVAMRIRRLLIEANIVHSASLVSDRITLSIGLATARSGQSLSPAQLIEEADAALYQAKHNGRNRIESGEHKTANLVVLAR